MSKRITDEEYNQVSDLYNKFMADPNQDPAKVARVNELRGQVQDQYKAQKASEPKIDNAWVNQDNTSTLSYDNGTTSRFDQQGNRLSIDNMYGNDDGTVTTVYNNGSKVITDQQGNEITSSAKTNEQLAKEVMQGKRGVGQARKNALANAGYDYNAVQKIVNQNFKPIIKQEPPKNEETKETETTTETQVTPSWIFKDVWPKVNIPTNNNVNENVRRNQPWYDKTTTISPVSHSDKRNAYQKQWLTIGMQNSNGYHPVYNKRGEVIDYLKN